MKLKVNIFYYLFYVLFIFGVSSTVYAKGLGDSCGKDLKTYCSQVLPGDGRIMACLYAHGDKIADDCVLEIQSVALKFSSAVEAIQHGYEMCSEDIKKFCAKAAPGEGRMYRCIKKHQPALSQACTSALGSLEVRFAGEAQE